MTWDNNLSFRALLCLTATLDEPMDVGTGPFGVRKILGVKEGRFEFRPESELPDIRGSVKLCSADFSTRGTDNSSLLIDVRSVLEVDGPQPVYIYAQYSSRVLLDEEMLRKLDRDEPIPRERSSFIVTPRFEVGIPEEASGYQLRTCQALQRLNTMAVVGHAALGRRRIEYEMYEIRNARI